MALNVSYFTGADIGTGQCYGGLISSVAYTVTGSSASVGNPPTGAKIARLAAGENCYVSNNGTTVSATNGIYIPAGSSIDIAVVPNNTILAITG
jgi:hypothetical protein